MPRGQYDRSKIKKRKKTVRMEVINDCKSKTLDIDLSSNVQYTSIRFMKGKSVIAELPILVQA